VKTNKNGAQAGTSLLLLFLLLLLLGDIFYALLSKLDFLIKFSSEMRINFIKFTWQQGRKTGTRLPIPHTTPPPHLFIILSLSLWAFSPSPAPSLSGVGLFVAFHLLRHFSLWNFRVDVVCLK